MDDKVDPLVALDNWRRVLNEAVRDDQPDLTMRQWAILLNVYLTPPPHTVRGLSAALNVPKPAITRALDTLGRQGLLRRKRDEADKRNILLQRTVKGSVFLRDFGDLVAGEWKAHVDLPARGGGVAPQETPQETPQDAPQETRALAAPPTGSSEDAA